MTRKKYVYSPTQSRNNKKSFNPTLYTYKNKPPVKIPRCRYCDPIKLNCMNRNCVNWHKLCFNANDCSHYINE